MRAANSTNSEVASLTVSLAAVIVMDKEQEVVGLKIKLAITLDFPDNGDRLSHRVSHR
jgi:hypothetical protein